jgi:hypothetical protein
MCKEGSFLRRRYLKGDDMGYKFLERTVRKLRAYESRNASTGESTAFYRFIIFKLKMQSYYIDPLRLIQV